jgi:hypothetical protein
MTNEHEQNLGIHFTSQSQLRIVGLTIDLNGVPSMERIELRTDIWPQWLVIARDEMELARAARDANPGMTGDEDSEFSKLLQREMRHSMTSICAIAFAFEAFANSVVHNLPEAANSVLPKTSAARRVHEIMRSGFKMSNKGSSAVAKTMREIFVLRNKAVHSSAAFAQPVQHPVFPAGFEPRLIMYRVENAETAYKFARDVLEQLPARARGSNAEWLAWCETIPVMLSEQVDTNV